MKATDLMIGDWLQFKYTRTLFRVYSIDHDKITNVDGATPFKIEDDLINPILLTPEILEKNGFEHIGYRYVYAGRRIKAKVYHYLKEEERRISYCNGEMEFLNEIFGIEIKMENVSFVHELQHALRLCKIELEIVL